MKRILFILFLGILALSSAKDPRTDYISRYSKLAVSEMQRTGVPASITLAQGILESASGLSELSVKANNHFGIKCHKSWTGGKTYHNAEKGKECFRVYKTPEESFRDHSDFLRYQDRYKFLFDLKKGDYKGWANGLRKAGYATDPAYPAKLIKIIEDYSLYRFDDAKVEIKSPVVLETPVEIETPVEVKTGAVNETVSVSLARAVYETNGVPFIYAIEGETFGSIAKSYKLFKKELLAFNDLSSDSPLKGGERVYLSRKKNKSVKGVDKYIVGEGEKICLRDAAQRFGVRLSALERLNPAVGGGILEEGDEIVLR